MRILTLIMISCLTFTASAEVYRSVDKDGNVVFSDEPSPDAELIELDELQTIQPPPVGNFEYTPPKKVKPRYSELSITSPADDLAIRNNAGNVTVNVSSSPRVNGGDVLVLYVDGKEIELGSSTTHSFTAMDRGTHQLRAVIKNSEGRILISSKSVNFHLLRQAVN